MLLELKLKNGTTLNIDDSYLKSNRYENTTSDAEEVRIGVATSSKLDFTIYNKNNILSGRKFEECEIIAKHDNGVQFGVFHCSDISKTKKTISIESEDNMLKFEKDWQGCSFPITTYDLLLNLCNQCEIHLKTPKEEIINSNIQVVAEDGLAGETCRTILKYLCAIFGSYANCDEYGELCIEYYDFKNIKDTIYFSDCKKFEVGETIAKRAGVLFINGTSEVQVGETSNAYIIEENPIIAQFSESVKKEIGLKIIDRVKYTNFVSGEFKFRTRTHLKEGDVIKVVEKNGDESICVISNIIIDNSNTCTIKSFGNIKNAKTSTSTSTSSKTSTSENYSKEIYLGRTQNHQRINIKGGSYTICEKLIKNVTSYSKVNLNLFANFNYSYTEDRVLFFDIYTNDKLVKTLKYQATQGFNQFSIGFLSDVDITTNTNLYSCRVTLLEDEQIIIEPFECQMSFIVKSCKIEDNVATDQYFFEKFPNISNIVFNQRKITHKSIYDNSEILVPALPIATGDMSRTSGVDNITYTVYDDGSCVISGNGEIKNGNFTDNFSQYGYNFSPDISDKEYIANNIKSITITGGITLIPPRIFQLMNGLETVTINSTTQCTFEYQYAAYGIMAGIGGIKTLNFGAGGRYIIETTNAFADLSIENVNGEEYIIKMDRDYTFSGTTITSSLDLSGCEEYHSNNLENLTCPYVTLSKNLKIVGGNTFKNSNFDSVFVVNSDMLNISFQLFAGDCFDNCCISTFIIEPNAADVFPNYFYRLENIRANNKKIYVPTPYDVGKYATLATDTYGFEVIGYNPDNYENILNEVWR